MIRKKTTRGTRKKSTKTRDIVTTENSVVVTSNKREHDCDTECGELSKAEIAKIMEMVQDISSKKKNGFLLIATVKDVMKEGKSGMEIDGKMFGHAIQKNTPLRTLLSSINYSPIEVLACLADAN